jgi:putative membrane protein
LEERRGVCGTELFTVPADGGWGMLIVGVLFWGSVFGLAVWGIRRLTGRADRDDRSIARKSPMEYLKKRYAKGEITKEQFDEIKRDLLSS